MIKKRFFYIPETMGLLRRQHWKPPRGQPRLQIQVGSAIAEWKDTTTPRPEYKKRKSRRMKHNGVEPRGRWQWCRPRRGWRSQLFPLLLSWGGRAGPDSCQRPRGSTLLCFILLDFLFLNSGLDLIVLSHSTIAGLELPFWICCLVCPLGCSLGCF